MDKRRLEQEYRSWKQQSTPDLWERIEEGLKDHEGQAGAFYDRKLSHGKEVSHEKEVSWEKGGSCGRKISHKRKLSYGRKAVYSGVTAAAAIFLLLMVIPDRRQDSWTGHYIAEETEGVQAPEAGSAAGGTQEPRLASGETQASEFGFASHETDGPHPRFLELGEYQSLAVPSDALTVPADARYFSEAVLGDTELLCSGTVEEVSLNYDGEGRAVQVVYRLDLQTIYYAQDYISSQESITVTSPLVAAEGEPMALAEEGGDSAGLSAASAKGNEVYLLYQLQKEGNYLLPLKSQNGSWELVYPFAPQIQVTEQGDYLFHSGYTSLVNLDTQVVPGIPMGSNDYFYDRMLLREDEEFPLELVALIKKQAKENG